MIFRRKYKLLKNETVVTESGITLYRIKALRSFGDVTRGEKGGYIKGEQNLSHMGECWVYDTSQVFDNARVSEDASVSDDSTVYGDAVVLGDAIVSCSTIYGLTEIYNSRIDNSTIEDAIVYNIRLDRCNVHGEAFTRIYGAENHEDETVLYDAVISKTDDSLIICGLGSRNGIVAFYRAIDQDSGERTISVTCGCFYGTLEEFREEVKKTHDGNIYEKTYLHAADLAEEWFSLNEDKCSE